VVVTGADLLDDPDALMAGNEWGGGLDWPVAAGGVDVGVAEPAGFDLHEHLFGAWHWDRNVLDREGLVKGVNDGGFHSEPQA
jgi:hypothetical protein